MEINSWNKYVEITTVGEYHKYFKPFSVLLDRKFKVNSGFSIFSHPCIIILLKTKLIKKVFSN